MLLNNRKKITSCFDGLNIPSCLAYSTFLVITNRDFYGLLDTIISSLELSIENIQGIVPIFPKINFLLF